MSKNVEINISNGSGYEALYPKTLVENVTNGVSITELTNQLNNAKNEIKIKKASGSWRGTNTTLGTGQNLLLKTITVGFFADIFILKNFKGEPTIANAFQYRLRAQSESNPTNYNSWGNNLVYGGDGKIEVISLTNAPSFSTTLWSQISYGSGSGAKYAVTNYKININSTIVKIYSTWSDYVYTENSNWETDNNLLIKSHLNYSSYYYWHAYKFYY